MINDSRRASHRERAIGCESNRFLSCAPVLRTSADTDKYIDLQINFVSITVNYMEAVSTLRHRAFKC